MIGFLIEHYAGAFPVWLCPEQARIVPITDGHVEYARTLEKRLRAEGIRVSTDASAERMNAKIRHAQLMKIPYMLVVGDQEVQAGTVSLRCRDGSRKDGMPAAEFIERAKGRISTRSAEL